MVTTQEHVARANREQGQERRARTTDARVTAVMGTTVHVIVTGGPAGLAGEAVARLHELEARWSRFRPDSEISLLNQHPGVPVMVSRETRTLIDRALRGHALTGGRYDPTLLPELRAVGYDRSFERLAPVGTTRRERRDPPRAARRSRSFDVAPAVTLDPVLDSVCLAPGTEIDPGGIGKGLAADMVVEHLMARGAAGAMVNVGGDLRAEGDPPDGHGWVVAVDDPTEPGRVLDTILLARGAVASTWRTRRVWSVDGTDRHHLLDPSTGAPASTGLAGVVVLSDKGWRAEVLAKGAFLAGADDAASLLAAAGAVGIAVTDDGAATDLGDVAPFRTTARSST